VSGMVGGPGGEKTESGMVGGPGGCRTVSGMIGGPGGEKTESGIFGGPGGIRTESGTVGGPGGIWPVSGMIGGPGGLRRESGIVGGPGGLCLSQARPPKNNPPRSKTPIPPATPPRRPGLLAGDSSPPEFGPGRTPTTAVSVAVLIGMSVRVVVLVGISVRVAVGVLVGMSVRVAVGVLVGSGRRVGAGVWVASGGGCGVSVQTNPLAGSSHGDWALTGLAISMSAASVPNAISSTSAEVIFWIGKAVRRNITILEEPAKRWVLMVIIPLIR
jgi:hypothetical protein